MFEDSLVESTGRIRTRSKWLAVGSFFLQAAVLAVFVLIPYLYPSALPPQAFTRLLMAPPPPVARAEVPAHATATRAVAPVMLSALTAPSAIPKTIDPTADDAVPGGADPGLERNVGNGDVLGGLKEISAPAAPPVVVEPKPRQGPVRVSAGVAAGQLIAPIKPVYPAIARAARIQGTVIVEATISKQGAVINARVVSGPAMLAQAALSAIEQARYQPYRLGDEPVEVETTISVVFRLDE